MSAAIGKVENARLVEQARGQAPGEWHEIARIRDATVYLVRSVPTARDFETHDDVDEMVVVLDGTFRLETPAGATAAAAGESLMVPRGTPHRTRHQAEVAFLLIR